jgi:predicted outer membrane repeat protein
VLSTFTVLNLADSGVGSLRQAISDANALAGADAIDFAPALRGTIALTGGQLEITDHLTIEGPGTEHLIISGQDASRVFAIGGSTTNVVMEGVTIAHGRASGAGVVLGGGMLNDGGVVTLSHVTFRDNTAAAGTDPAAVGVGGAIASTGSSAVLAVDHTTFTGNRATGYMAGGGAIADLFGAHLTVAHSIFADNEVIGQYRSIGGGIMTDGGASLLVQHSSFAGNSVTSSLVSAPIYSVAKLVARSRESVRQHGDRVAR